MKVLVSGSSGLIGSAVLQRLRDDGHEIGALPRTYENSIDFSSVDAVVHLAGENIAHGRWTRKKKRRIEQSRVNGTRQLVEQLANSPKKPSVFISASAIGFYGNRNDELLDESSEAGTGFLSDVCKKWEAAALFAQKAGIRTVNIRTGVVLSTKGGALKGMLLPFKSGCGGVLGNGLQYISWISLADVVEIIRFLIDNDSINGAVNLVSPHPVTNREFTKTLGQVLNRPTILPLPACVVRIILGEMAEELLLSGCRVVPKKLLSADYTFIHSDLKVTLEKLLSRSF